MRLIPIQLLNVCPRQQLLGQVREFTAMCKDIYIYGRVNHILINRINDYDINNLYIYGQYLIKEMNSRNYKIKDKTINKWYKYLNIKDYKLIDNVYDKWFTDRYIKQVLYNWQEKYDCGGIKEKEWNKIINKFGYLIK